MNIKLYIDYSNSSGKSRALFGIKEAINFSYRKFIVIYPAIAIVITLFKARYEEFKSIAITIILISIMTIYTSLFSVWKLYI